MLAMDFGEKVCVIGRTTRKDNSASIVFGTTEGVVPNTIEAEFVFSVF